jgi:hypothetical protein
MEQDERTVTEGSGIGRSEQVMSPTIPDSPNNQERYQGGVLNRTSQDETPLGVDDELIHTPSTPGGATTCPGNWERRIDHLEEMLQSVLITVADAREQSRGRSVRRSKTKKATRDETGRRKKKTASLSEESDSEDDTRRNRGSDSKSVKKSKKKMSSSSAMNSSDDDSKADDESTTDSSPTSTSSVSDSSDDGASVSIKKENPEKSKKSKKKGFSNKKVDALLLHKAIRDIQSYKGSGEVEDLVNFLKKNKDLHEEVELSNERKIMIAT